MNKECINPNNFQIIVADFENKVSAKFLQEIETLGDITVVKYRTSFMSTLKDILFKPCIDNPQKICSNNCKIVYVFTDINARFNQYMTVIDYLSYVSYNVRAFDFSFKEIDLKAIYEKNKEGNAKLASLHNEKESFKKAVEIKRKIQEQDRQERVKILQKSKVIVKKLSIEESYSASKALENIVEVNEVSMRN